MIKALTHLLWVVVILTCGYFGRVLASDLKPNSSVASLQYQPLNKNVEGDSQMENSTTLRRNLGIADKPRLFDPGTNSESNATSNLVTRLAERKNYQLEIGATYDTTESIMAFVKWSETNLNIYCRPSLSGSNQKIQVQVQGGMERQDYVISLLDPCFFLCNQGIEMEFHRHQMDFESPNNIFDEAGTGGKVSLHQNLFGEHCLTGNLEAGVEQVDVSLNSGWHDQLPDMSPGMGSPGFPSIADSRNVPMAIVQQVGEHLFQVAGASLLWDSRPITLYPNHGNKTEISTAVANGDSSFYKVELASCWYFSGFVSNHTFRVIGRASSAASMNGNEVPFFERYYLGGVNSLRGYKFREIGFYEAYDPNNPNVAHDPTGGDSCWFGSLEYSIPLFEKREGISLRGVLFYDIGALGRQSWEFSSQYSDDTGVGLRLNIPKLSVLQMDYAFPLTHDSGAGSGGQIQFNITLFHSF